MRVYFFRSDCRFVNIWISLSFAILSVSFLFVNTYGIGQKTKNYSCLFCCHKRQMIVHNSKLQFLGGHKTKSATGCSIYDRYGLNISLIWKAQSLIAILVLNLLGCLTSSHRESAMSYFYFKQYIHSNWKKKHFQGLLNIFICSRIFLSAKYFCFQQGMGKHENCSVNYGQDLVIWLLCHSLWNYQQTKLSDKQDPRIPLLGIY